MTSISLNRTQNAFALQQQSRTDERPSDFQDLFKSLESGNLEDAQAAIDKIKSPFGDEGSANDPLASVREALASGDVQAAQKAFGTFETQMKTNGPPAGARPPGPPPGGAKQNGVQFDLSAILAKSTFSVSA
jgi:hypothetical protein